MSEHNMFDAKQKRSGGFKLARRTAHNGLILALCGLLVLLEPQASAWLALDRAATLEDHQFWRLLTGHWVHLSAAHYGLNALGFALIVLIFQQEQAPLKDSCAFVFISMCSSILLLAYSPAIENYVGLSGVLHGYFVFYLARGFKTTPWLNLAAWIGITVKVFLEQAPDYDSSATAQLIQGRVAVDAHLYGYMCGMVLIVVMLIARKISLNKGV